MKDDIFVKAGDIVYDPYDGETILIYKQEGNTFTVRPIVDLNTYKKDEKIEGANWPPMWKLVKNIKLINLLYGDKN